jgi:putative Mn2+ efflux pump MntP
MPFMGWIFWIVIIVLGVVVLKSFLDNSQKSAQWQNEPIDWLTAIRL